MIVFKNYFKIAKKYLPLIIMYISIFVFFTIMATSNNDKNSTFTASKPKLAIINNDENSLITSEFIEYAKEQSTYVEIDNDHQKMKDALFYRYVDYIMIIPNGFGDSLLKNELKTIDTLKVPGSYNAMYTEMLLERFLNIANIYIEVGMPEDKLINNIKKDLEEQTKVILLDQSTSDIQNLKFFYNFANYTFLAICIYIIGILSSTYNELKIKRRNNISSTSYRKINLGLTFGNLTICLFVWLLCVGITFILYKDAMQTVNGTLYILNSLVFMIFCLSLGTLIGTLVQNKEAQSGIVNVIALGTSFICGAFVPQEYLGASIIKVSQIFPSYWYIKGNELIAKYANNNLNEIIKCMVIVFICSLLFLIINNLITKSKRKEG